MGQARERIAAGVSHASVAAKGHFDAEARRSGGESTQKRVVTVNSAHSDDDGESSDGARRQLTGYIWNIIHHQWLVILTSSPKDENYK